MSYTVAALYRFVPLQDPQACQAPLAALCARLKLRGTLLLAPEGINGTVAGAPASIAALVEALREGPLFAGRLRGMEVRYSTASAMPFRRMRVRLKKEIVTLRQPEADPIRWTGIFVAPEEWNALISDPAVLVIDTRNDFEVEMGSFAGARNPHTARFGDFPGYVARHLDPQRDRKIAMFCTGGIRCEKASAYLLARGFETVYQLKGGILNYLERIGESESLWQGKCFVFDERVALTHGLAEAGPGALPPQAQERCCANG
ncbi:MAG: rhodanese-related sulfurtransferase [Alphaproteobacteria bacterium]|nr:MAG: rhodanese-related sulfurtransferase [Alphaproteobacteria bacterium]